MKSARPTMLSHVAYITHDTAATAEFYSDVLGMELVNAVLDDSIPSTGEAVPYFHSFFRMSDGSTIAFFEAPELPPEPAPSHPAYDMFRHLALQVDTTEDVDRLARLARRERRRCARARRPQDRLQRLLPRPERGAARDHHAPRSRLERHRSACTRVLDEWEHVKATARQSGRDMVTVLKALTVERSHRRAGCRSTDARAERHGRSAIPKLISVDDHVVEPAHVWERWLPAKYRDRGPRSCAEAWRASTTSAPPAYVEHFDDDSPHEGRLLALRRPRVHAQADGRRRRLSERGDDAHSDHVRRHAARVLRPERAPRRHGRELGRSVDVLPDACRGSAARRSLEGTDKELGLACVKAYNDWMVEEWCGDSGGRLIPLCIIPLWDVDAGGDEVRRNAARGVRAVVLQRAAVPPRAADDPLRLLGSVLRRVRRHRHRGRACTSARRRRCRPRRRTRRRRSAATLAFGNAMTSLIDFLLVRGPGAVPEAEARLRRESDRVDPVRAGARRRRVGRQPGLGARPSTSPSRRRPTTTGTSTAA